MFENRTQNHRERIGRFLRTRAYPLYWRLSLVYWWSKNKYYIRKLKSREDLDPSSKINLGNKRESDTVFLLGSGCSINNITDEEWEIIHTNDSIGLNRWFIHEHVPDFYVMEFPRGEWRQTCYDILKLKESQYHNVPILIKNVSTQSSVLESSKIPDKLLDNFYLTNGIPLPWDGNTIESFEESLRYVNKSGYLEESDIIEINFQRRGSISYLMLLAVQLGYDNVVLCGVDMLNSDYFFESAKYDGFEIDLPETQNGSMHKTYDSTIDELTLDKVIYAINRVILEPRGINLYVGSKPTALYQCLDYYFEK